MYEMNISWRSAPLSLRMGIRATGPSSRSGRTGVAILSIDGRNTPKSNRKKLEEANVGGRVKDDFDSAATVFQY